MEFERYYIDLFEMLNTSCKKIASGKYDKADTERLFEKEWELLKPENKNQNKARSQRIISVSKKTFLLEKHENPGWLRRFLDWIAKGADKSSMGKASCPTWKIKR